MLLITGLISAACWDVADLTLQRAHGCNCHVMYQSQHFPACLPVLWLLLLFPPPFTVELFYSLSFIVIVLDVGAVGRRTTLWSQRSPPTFTCVGSGG